MIERARVKFKEEFDKDPVTYIFCFSLGALGTLFGVYYWVQSSDGLDSIGYPRPVAITSTPSLPSEQPTHTLIPVPTWTRVPETSLQIPTPGNSRFTR